MWIKTLETGTHRAMLVNMDRIDTVSIDNVYNKFQLVAFGQLTSNEDFANIATLFEGSEEDCRACLDWIYSQLDWNNAVGDINIWWHNRQPVDPGEFPDEPSMADADEANDIPF